MLNTLANHGFLPRDGRNITRNIIIDGLGSALNFNSSLASLMFDMAIIANPEPNATFFTLDQLNRHNVLEHDASLSRSDAYFGNNHVFNETIFEETLQYWTAPTLDTTMLANGKLARQINSKAFNPTYTFTQKTESFSLGEIGAPIVAFGDLKTGRVSRALVEYFFRNERFPIELGWSTRSEVVSLDDITQITNMVANAANLLTDSSSTKSASRRDLHAGLGF
ncbi:Chloroperoxidase [Aspergillus ambiguus]|uniref:peroxidase family protein n=1 Tax=Aspergillus ambiguus TaxID=176160 RepID=UPI003CCCB0F6